jgi:hypothetical protein
METSASFEARSAPSSYPTSSQAAKLHVCYYSRRKLSDMGRVVFPVGRSRLGDGLASSLADDAAPSVQGLAER